MIAICQVDDLGCNLSEAVVPEAYCQLCNPYFDPFDQQLHDPSLLRREEVRLERVQLGKRLPYLTLGHILQFRLRGPPRCDDHLGRSQHRAKLIDDRCLDLCRRHSRHGAGTCSMLQDRLAHIVAVEPVT